MTASEELYFTYMWDNISTALRIKIYIKFRIYKFLNSNVDKLGTITKVAMTLIILAYASKNN